MKKTFLTLVLSAVCVWGYVIMQIILVLLGGTDSTAKAQGQATLPAAALLSRSRAALDTTFRDPFQSYLYSQKPALIMQANAVGRPVLKAIEPPRAVLSGILWGDEPVAILKQDGATELVKKGASIWDLTVIRIERNQVIVQKQGRSFTLGY